MNTVVALAAIVAAADLPQRLRQLRQYTAVQRAAVAGGWCIVAAVLAVVATPLLRGLDISAPNAQIAAGLVVGLWSIAAFFRWSDEPAPSPVAGGLVPGLFPIVLTPPLAVMVVAAAARNGLPVPLLAAALVAAALATPPRATALLASRPARLVSASAGVVLATVVVVDGVLSI